MTITRRICGLIYKHTRKPAPQGDLEGGVSHKFAGNEFGQRSVSVAGPAGVTYREVGHSAPVPVHGDIYDVERIRNSIRRGGRAVDKFAGSEFGQRSVSVAGPAGVTYREVAHSAPVPVHGGIYDVERIRNSIRRGGRAVECTGLENRQGLIALRGFESHPLRHRCSKFSCKTGIRQSYQRVTI